MSYPGKPAQSPSSCYFCNTTMEAKYLAEHLMHCGAVLEECPERCGVYVPRQELREHLAQCLRSSRTSLLDEQIRSLKEAAWKNKVVSTLGLLRAAVHEGEQQVKGLRDTLASSLQVTNEALRKDILEELFDNRAHISSINSRLSNLERSCNDLRQSHLHSLHRVCAKLDELKVEDTRVIEEREKWHCALEETRASFAADSAATRKLWQEQLRHIHDMRLELEMRCKLSNQLVDKYNELFDKVETLDRQLQRNSDSIAEQSAVLNTLTRENATKEAMSSRSCVQYYECSCDREFSSCYGRLVWRIDGYEAKMEDAKKSDAVLYSPKFNDREYGYTMRLELYLNGLGKWKNRHVIGCLRIVDGKWDPLLDWPCEVKADVTLRDQENPINDVDKIVKTVKGGERDDEVVHNSDLYMFIPHTTIARHSGYTKGDVMFLDVRIKRQKFNGSTMSLV